MITPTQPPTDRARRPRRTSSRTRRRAGVLLSLLLLGVVTAVAPANAEELPRMTVRARVTYRDSSRLEIKPISGAPAAMAALWGMTVDVTSSTRISTLDGKNRLRSLRSGMVVDIEVVVRPGQPGGGGPGLGCGITLNGKPGCGPVWNDGSYQSGIREAVTITQVRGSCLKSTARLGDVSWTDGRPETALCRVRGGGTDELVLTIHVRGGDKLMARLPGTEARWQWGSATAVTTLTQISPAIYTASTSIPASTATSTKFSVYWFGDGPDDGHAAKLYKLFVNKRLK